MSQKKENRLKVRIEKVLLILGVVYFFYVAPNSYALTFLKSKTIDYTKNIDIHNGDFIFQHLPGPLTTMIAEVTHSQYSHCGIIVKKKQGIFVLEAIGPVRLTPINEWISRGVGDRFTIVRLKEPYQRFIPQIIKEAEKYMERPYDIQYEWDDKKIYCSELIQKAVKEGAGIELARFVRLGDLDWRPYEKTIRYIANGSLPLERTMITPEDIVLSNSVYMVYSSFPVKPIEGVRYTLKEFKGFWSGTYMLENTALDIQVEIDEKGIIRKGELGSGLYIDPSGIRRLSFRTGEFSYRFITENHVRIFVNGKMNKSKGSIFGKWRDSLGFSGTFLIIKKS